MFKAILHRIKYGNSFAAVEHCWMDGEERFELLVLKKEKKAFQIENAASYVNSVEIFNGISKNQHLFLIVNNDKVITKQIPLCEDVSRALRIAFPNIKIDDFYYEVSHNATSSEVAICRKRYIDALVDDYKKRGNTVIGCSLGNNGISVLNPYFEAPVIHTSNAVINRTAKEIVSVNHTQITEDSDYVINGLKLTNFQVLPLAGILQVFGVLSGTTGNLNAVIRAKSTQYFQQKITFQGLKVGLGILMAALIVNYLIFDYYNKEFTSLMEKQQINSASKTRFLQLNEEVQKKQKLVDEIVYGAVSEVSYYLDMLGEMIPGDVILTELKYQPLGKPVEVSKPIEYSDDIIVISGQSKNGLSFTNWVKEIEAIEWVNYVNIKSFGTNNKSVTNFELELNLEIDGKNT